MALIDFRVPEPPNVEATYTEEKLRVLAWLASCYGHLIGWRFRAISAKEWTYPGVYNYTTAPPATDTRRMRFRTRPSAEWLYLVLEYQADPEASTAPEIVVELQDPTGATTHDAITFARDGGGLGVESVAHYSPLIAGWVFEYPFLRTETPAITQTQAGRPRLIEVPSAARGAECVLVFDMTSVRLRSATLWEWPLQETTL